MVALPRTCEYCGSRMMHYGSCGCPDASLVWIRNEREKLKERLIRLDKLEADQIAKIAASSAVTAA
jgi:hypothetical protein